MLESRALGAQWHTAESNCGQGYHPARSRVRVPPLCQKKGHGGKGEDFPVAQVLGASANAPTLSVLRDLPLFVEREPTALDGVAYVDDAGLGIAIELVRVGGVQGLEKLGTGVLTGQVDALSVLVEG